MTPLTTQACPVCQATFPESWKRPVDCNHKHPGRDWRMRSQPRAEQQRETSHWNPLHQYPVDHAASWNIDAAESWFAAWTSRIPNYGCACQMNFAAYCEQSPPDFSSADAFFVWTVAAHNYVSLNHVQPRKLPMTVKDARQRFRMPTRRGLVQHFISWDEFTADTLALTQQILDRFPTLAGVAGCPRSGMRAAADIALRLGVPLYEASAKNGLRKLAGGVRLDGKVFEDAPLVVVEDSACTGQSVTRLRSHEELQSLPVYAVYATQQASKLLSGYAVAIEPPHWFDWHFFHCRELLKQHAVGIDWDGVLNVDCPRECDDDGPNYREWLDAVRPIRRPDWIPTIITARLETYRDQCLQWLARYRIEFDRLVMFPGSFVERAKTNIGLWKASMCDEHGVEMYVESDLMLAQTIAAKRNKLTLSIEKP